MTGFVPVAFLTMILIVLWQGHNLIPPIHWRLFFMELILMASGFVASMLLVTSKESPPKRWRTSFSGVVAVFSLGLLSAFLQGAHLATIIVASILAGAFAALVTREPPDRADRKGSDRGLKNLSLYLTLLACTIAAILFTLTRYILVVRSHGGELNLLVRLDYAILVSVAPALGVLFLVRSRWLSSSWKRIVPVYALSFTLIFALQFFAAIVRGR
jgi:hypothetical protein